MSPANAVEMLVQDHLVVSNMFEQFEGMPPDRRAGLVREIIRSLETHARVEEDILYPYIRAEVPDGDRLMDEAVQEHQEAKDLMARLRELQADEPEFEEAFQALKEGIQHHVQEEEGEVFPKLRESADEATLAELGQRIAQAMALSPPPDVSNR